MHTATADPLVGRTLEGRYRILDRIARGGMSTVYVAIDERLDRLVAVKVMASSLSTDPAFSDRFRREARAAARLAHLNTVAVYDQGDDQTVSGRHVFLVMELVSGRTLRDLIRERAPVSPAEAVSLMEPILSALAAAHRAGLVHRDVKPENILLSDEGLVKVADFGLARAVESDPSATRTGLMMGTVAYCSPEQVSRGRADQRSDVYSAGVVFFELLTGQPPYRGDSAMNIAYQHVHSRVPPPSSRMRGIPPRIDEIVQRATSPDPGARQLDAGAFLAELADVRSDLGLPVVPLAPRPRAPARNDAMARAMREPYMVSTDVLERGFVAGHNTSVVPGGYAAPPEVDQRRHQAQPAAAPPAQRRPRSARSRRRRRSLISLLAVVILGTVAVYAGWWIAAGRYGKVPNVADDNESAAISALRHAGYQVSASITSQYSESVPGGEVLSTIPSIGSRVPHGRTIALVLSKGKQHYAVPSVANDTVAQARSTLGAIPVPVASSTTSQPSDTVPAGKVIGTNPAAGASVTRDQTLTIVVSSGPPIISIPALSANTSAQAEQQSLQQLGFKTQDVSAYSTTVPNDDVISLDPSTSARKFSTIILTVSKGPQIVTVPSIQPGIPLDQAEALLRQAGLNYTVNRFTHGNDTVLGISPESGTPVAAGTTITIYTF